LVDRVQKIRSTVFIIKEGTHTGLVAREATATARVVLRKVGLEGRLLGSITLAMPGHRPVYSPRRGFWLSVGVQFRVIACDRERGSVRNR
jgi:hypothetical protein